MRGLLEHVKKVHQEPADWSLERYAGHSLRVLLVVWVILTAACILIGLAMGRPTYPFKESKPYTYYLVAVLALCAVVCFQCARAAPSASRRIWTLMWVGFAFLTLDDACLIHENIDKLVHHILGADRRDYVTDHLDDMIILAYGLIGMVVLFRHRRELLKLRYFARGITWAFVFFFVMVFFDLTAGYPVGLGGNPGFIIEEGAEGLGAVLFLWTFTVCRFQLRNPSQTSTSEPAAGRLAMTHAANLSTGPPAQAGEPSKADSPVG